MILKIKNKKVDYFNSFNLNLKYDAVASTFSFNFEFDPDNAEHKEIFRPGAYPIVTVEHNDELLLTGYILSSEFNRSSVKELCKLGGYSLPGVMEDCEIPVSLYPLQSDGLTLRQIASKLLHPFNLKMVVDPAVAGKMDSVFVTTTADEKQTIKSYLAEIASQKNIIISHNEKGEVLFTKSKPKQNPLLNYSDGQPFTKIELAVNGQAMHSHITVQKQADADAGNAGESTVTNPYVTTVYRPKVKTQSSGTDTDTDLAAKNALANELRNIKLTITTDRWTDDKGKILKPNNIVSIISPENYIYKKTLFFIESINFVGDNIKTTAVISCCLPEVHSGETAKNIFTQ